jgi:hypothetical protein
MWSKTTWWWPWNWLDRRDPRLHMLRHRFGIVVATHSTTPIPLAEAELVRLLLIRRSAVAGVRGQRSPADILCTLYCRPANRTEGLATDAERPVRRGCTRRTGRYRERLNYALAACEAVRVTTPSGMPSLNAVTPKVELRAPAPVAVSLATVP